MNAIAAAAVTSQLHIEAGKTLMFGALPGIRSGGVPFGTLGSTIDRAQKAYPEGGGMAAANCAEVAALREKPMMLGGQGAIEINQRCRVDLVFAAKIQTGARLSREALTEAGRAPEAGTMWLRYCQCREREGEDALIGFVAQWECMLATGNTRW